MEVTDYNYPVMDVVLEDILSAVAPSRDDYVRREGLISDLNVVIQSIQNLKGARVEPFGSFVANLYTKYGDVDISIDLPNPSIVKREKLKVLKQIMAALRRGGAHHSNSILRLIPGARVPVLVYESKYTNISCDISINNPCGQLKSKCLLWISQIDGRFRELILLVKEWAKSKRVNDPKQGLLSSYALCLLVIFHFQTCEPAILPPLHDIFEESLSGAQGIDNHIQSRCTENIAKFTRQRLTNLSSLSELFVSFFQKFSRIQLLSADYTVSTYRGKWEPRNQPKWASRSYKLIVEDPFDQSDNAARAVGLLGFTKIAAAIQQTCQTFSSSTLSRSSMLADFMRPVTEIANPKPPLDYNSFRPKSAAEKHNMESSANAREPRNQKRGGKPKSTPAFGSVAMDQNVSPIPVAFSNMRHGMHIPAAATNANPLQNQNVSPLPVVAANIRQRQNQSPFPGQQASYMTQHPNQYHQRMKADASMVQCPNQHSQRALPMQDSSATLTQNKSEFHGPQVNAAAGTRPRQNQYSRPNHPNSNGFHQVEHMGSHMMQENYRSSYNERRNSSRGTGVWRPVYGNNPQN